jgi:hypothetical protein
MEQGQEVNPRERESETTSIARRERDEQVVA